MTFSARQLRSDRDSLKTNLTDRDDKIIQLESSLDALKRDNSNLVYSILIFRSIYLRVPIFRSKQKKYFQQLFELKRNNRLMKDDYLSMKTNIDQLIADNTMATSATFASICGVLDTVKETGKGNGNYIDRR